MIVDPLVLIEVNDSYGRCLLNTVFFDRFYDIFFSSDAAIAPLFAKTDMEKQKSVLRHSLASVLAFAGPHNAMAINTLKRIRISHNRQHINIKPALYTYWIESLIQAVAECDPKFNTKLESSWRIVVQVGVDYVREGYNEVDQQSA